MLIWNARTWSVRPLPLSWTSSAARSAGASVVRQALGEGYWRQRDVIERAAG